MEYTPVCIRVRTTCVFSKAIRKRDILGGMALSWIIDIELFVLYSQEAVCHLATCTSSDRSMVGGRP